MSINKHLFDFLDYRKYLEMRLPVRGEERGARSKLAKALNCQTTYISQVLGGETNFSLEHGIEINEYFGHSENESEYFLLLLQFARAGNKKLESYFLQKIRKAQAARKFIEERFQARENLSLENQAKYYSAWYFAAIHMFLLIPQMRNAQALADHLKLPAKTVSEVLEFLVASGLAVHNGKEFQPGKARIHLSEESDLVAKHHTNWRMQSIRATDFHLSENYFYSSPICMSEKDAADLKTSMQKLIAEFEPVILASKEEAVFCVNMDFFRV